MSKDLKVFKNELFEVGVTLENENMLFDAEMVARNLGIVSKTTKSGVVYENVRWSRVNDFLPQDAEIKKGDLIPESMVYMLAFKASNEVAIQFQMWLATDVIPSIRKSGGYSVSTNRKEDFEMQLIGAEYSMKMLRMDDTSKVVMLEKVHKQHGVHTSHLPVYIDEEVTKSITALLKENNTGITSAKANTKLIELGILEIKERPSSNGATKEFKSLTENGLYYGKNLLNPRSPKETQPHYYESKFSELLSLLK